MTLKTVGKAIVFGTLILGSRIQSDNLERDSSVAMTLIMIGLLLWFGIKHEEKA